MSRELPAMSVTFSVATLGLSAIACACLIVLIRPWLQRYALAQPNARSSHKIPTPQGGGIAVIAATVVVSACAVLVRLDDAAATPLAMLFAAVILIAGAGVVADIRPVDVAPRLLLQALAVAAVIYALPE